MPDLKNYGGGTPKTLSEINMSVVLDRIRRGDNVSRSSLVKELNLSFPSISRIVDTLIEKEYVIEGNLGLSSGGKRPRILKFNTDLVYVVGIGVDVDFIEVMLTDFSGNEIKTIYERFEEDRSPKEMIRMIVSYIQKIIHSAGVEEEKVKVIALGLPAMQDTNTGTIRVCPTIPDWEGINLSKVLNRETGKDILIDNVANLSLLGEVWKGAAIGYDNVVMITIGTGVGAGILINGKLYRGAQGSAGEIGSMYIDKQLTQEDTHPFGQFEFLASDIALKKKLDEKNVTLKNSTITKEDLENETIERASYEIVDNFAYGITNLITVLNPEVVVIRGELFKESKDCMNYLREKIKGLIPFKAQIIESVLEERGVTIGAVNLALSYLDTKILSPFFQ